jgi:hypothetical protein
MTRRTTPALAAALFVALALAAPSQASTISRSPVSTTIGTTNVTPMWGPMIPKVVYDGPSGWFYTSTLDGTGTQYPWIARIWKSHDQVTWTLAATLNNWVYQPPGLILDSGNRLWLDVPCYTGGQCYPGVAPASGSAQQYVYLVRLQFATRLGDGSFDFSLWNDQSVRTTTAERYYRGLTIDASRRYIYSTYSKTGWGLYFSSFDTWTNTEVTNLIGSPGSNEAYLYPRIRRGTASGEVWLLFNQTLTGTGSSATIYGVQLWRSTDGGVTFPQNQRFMVAYCPNPDGVNNWCDAADLAVDGSDAPHVLFYKKIAGVSHLYYWKGSPGSVTLTGSPVDLGAYDNHSQLQLGASDERFVFATAATSDFSVLRSTNGTVWSTQVFPVSGTSEVYSPNLLRKESGTFPLATNVFAMLLSERPTGSTVFSRLDYLTYTG